MNAESTGEEGLRLAVSARPEQVPPRAALAGFLCGEGRREEALTALRDGLLFAAGREDRLAALAEAFVAADAWPDAIGTLQMAQRVAPADEAIAARLGGLWARLGEQETATRQLFNQYAAGFDNHLLGCLRYAAPAALERLLLPYSRRFSEGTAIDLGCGTGLMGERLHGRVGRLLGVDLSPGMLEQARAKGIYDELAEADAVTFLQRVQSGAALVAAADVLVYIGDLQPLFAAVAAALSQHGLFAFTVEELPGDGFALNAAKRYAHSASYIHAVSAQARLHVLACETIVPRHDSGKPVDGLMLLLERSTARWRSD